MSRRVTKKDYRWTFLGLLVLTSLTFGLSYLHLGWGSTVIAMSIATAKATLIVLFFMHLVEQGPSNVFAVVFSVLMILLLVLLSTADVWTRDHFGILPPGA